MSPETALLLTDGVLNETDAKTAHGLIRGPSRYRIVGVVDDRHAGQDAGVVLDGHSRGIPVFVSLADACARLGEAPDCLVVGVATHGGVCPPRLKTVLLDGARRGISLVNGLHDLLSEDPDISAACAASGARITDIRRPRPFRELHFWSGAALDLAVPRVAVLGTDCALGKRTTCTLLAEACRTGGLRAELVYTGQTGWLQGHPYGFILDATPNDFVSGELEHALVACARDAAPDVIFIEGQSGLRNPSGPCGAELILSGGARGVVLVHAPARRCFDGLEERDYRIPPLENEIALLGYYSTEVLGIALNTRGLGAAARTAARDSIARATGLPVALPLEDGVGALVPAVRRFVEAQASARRP